MFKHLFSQISLRMVSDIVEKRTELEKTDTADVLLEKVNNKIKDQLDKLENVLLEKEEQLLKLKEKLKEIIELNEELINKETDIKLNKMREDEIVKYKQEIEEIDDELGILDQEAEDHLRDKKSLGVLLKLNEYIIQVYRKSIEANK